MIKHNAIKIGNKEFKIKLDKKNSKAQDKAKIEKEQFPDHFVLIHINDKSTELEPDRKDVVMKI